MEEWEIWEEEEQVAKSKKEAKKLVPEKFHKMDKSIQEETVREDAYEKIVGSYDRC